jgi:tRNA threonylcarbamoyladenosine biosynthesis protein TsaE
VSVTRQSSSVEQTEAIASELAGELRGGDCVALIGQLGAGKTQFVRGLVRGLNGPIHQVSSPTFVLLHVYPGGRLTVYHLDAYRLAGSQDLEAIGFTELLEQGGIAVVEWADRVSELLPRKRIEINIDLRGPTQREIRLVRRDGKS